MISHHQFESSAMPFVSEEEVDSASYGSWPAPAGAAAPQEQQVSMHQPNSAPAQEDPQYRQQMIAHYSQKFADFIQNVKSLSSILQKDHQMRVERQAARSEVSALFGVSPIVLRSVVVLEESPSLLACSQHFHLPFPQLWS